MTRATHGWRTRAAGGAFTSGLALLLATLSVLAGTVTPTAAQSLTRGPVMIETHPTDLAGNIRLSTNEAGDVTQRLDYAPFGEVDGRSCTGGGDPTLSPKFQGKLRDPKTCLDDFGARDYYMVTGRFPSVAPVLPVETALRDPQQWNRDAYARNNPLIYTDPDGRALVVLGVPVAAAAAAAEVASTTYDVCELHRVVSDPNASRREIGFQVAVVGAGTVLPGSGAMYGKLVKLTARNARINLMRFTGMMPDGADAHHAFAQKFAPFIASKGININDPKFLMWWEKSEHRQETWEFNKRWEEYIRTNGDATYEQVLELGRDLARQYGFTPLF